MRKTIDMFDIITQSVHGYQEIFNCLLCFKFSIFSHKRENGPSSTFQQNRRIWLRSCKAFAKLGIYKGNEGWGWSKDWQTVDLQ